MKNALLIIVTAGLLSAFSYPGDIDRPVPKFAGAHTVACVKIVGHTQVSQFGQPHRLATVRCVHH